MAKITLEVNKSKLPTVLNILENLKSGLITKIDVQKEDKIEPVSSSLSNSRSTSKYLSPNEFKNRLKKG